MAIRNPVAFSKRELSFTAPFQGNSLSAINIQMSKLKHVAIVGATGAVGVEMLRCLEQRNFPVGELTLLASARSAGKKLKFKGADVTVKELTADSFTGVDIALFSAGGGISKEFAPHAVKAGAWWWTTPAPSAWTTTCRSSCRRSTPPT